MRKWEYKIELCAAAKELAILNAFGAEAWEAWHIEPATVQGSNPPVFSSFLYLKREVPDVGA